MDPNNPAVFITTPALAKRSKTRILASPKFANIVLSSSSLADGTVIAVVPRGLVTGYDGTVAIDLSTEAVLHYESSAPLPIVDGSGVAASPTFSAFQTDTTVLGSQRPLRLGG